MESHYLNLGTKVVIREGTPVIGKKIGHWGDPYEVTRQVVKRGKPVLDEQGQPTTETVTERPYIPTGSGPAPTDIRGTIHAITAEHVKVSTSAFNILSIPKLTINDAIGAADLLGFGTTLTEQLGLPRLPFSAHHALRRSALPGDLALHLPDHRVVQIAEVKDNGICAVRWPGQSGTTPIDSRLLVPFFCDPNDAPQYGFPTFEEVVGTNSLGYLNRVKCFLVDTEEKLEAMLDDLYFAADLTLDTETRGLLAEAFIDHEDFVLGICLAGDANTGYYIPIGHLDPEKVKAAFPEYLDDDGRLTRAPRTREHGYDLVRSMMYPGQLDRHYVVEKLRPLIEAKRIIMHNSAFDLVAMDTLGVRIPYDRYADTLFVSKLHNENRPTGHGLKALAGAGYFSKAEGKHVPSIVRRKVRIKFSDTAEDNVLTFVHPFQCCDYAAADASDTAAVNEQLEPEIKRIPSIWAYYHQVELPFNRRVVVDHIITGGVRVKREPIAAVDRELKAEIAATLGKIGTIVEPFVQHKRAVHDYSVSELRHRIAGRITAHYIMDPPEQVDALLRDLERVVSLDALQALDAATTPERLRKLDRTHHAVLKAADKPCDNFTFDVGKKAHLIELIHHHWGLKVVKLTKSGLSSITKNTIPYLRAQTKTGSAERDFFDLLIKHAQAAKLVQAFTGPLLIAIDKSLDGFIHPDFSSLGAKSSRSSCRLPNLQQLPSRSKYDVRAAFVPDDDDHLFQDCDYEAQELRVMAAFSQDPKMLELVAAGADLHCYTVRAVWPELADLSDDEIKTNHKSKRNAAKAVMFGIAYGIGAAKLAEGLTAEALSEGKPENAVTKEQAQAIIDGFKRRAYPRLAKWFDEIAATYRRVGYMDLPGGYRRRHSGFFDDASESASIRSCCNTNIQGTSGTMMKQAALRVLDLMELMVEVGEIEDFRISMIIHDQLINQTHKKDALKALGYTETAMSTNLLGVPVPVEGHLARSYSKHEEKWYKKALKRAVKEHGVDAVLASDLTKLEVPADGDDTELVYDRETPHFIAVEAGEIWDDSNEEIAA